MKEAPHPAKWYGSCLRKLILETALSAQMEWTKETAPWDGFSKWYGVRPPMTFHDP